MSSCCPIPASPHPYNPMSLHPHIPAFMCPHHIAASPHPCSLTSPQHSSLYLSVNDVLCDGGGVLPFYWFLTAFPSTIVF